MPVKLVLLEMLEPFFNYPFQLMMGMILELLLELLRELKLGMLGEQ